MKAGKIILLLTFMLLYVNGTEIEEKKSQIMEYEVEFHTKPFGFGVIPDNLNGSMKQNAFISSMDKKLLLVSNRIEKGDQIICINFENVNGKSHNYIIQLLQCSILPCRIRFCKVLEKMDLLTPSMCTPYQKMFENGTLTGKIKEVMLATDLTEQHFHELMSTLKTKLLISNKIGKIIQFEMDMDYTILRVKQKLQSSENILVNNQELFKENTYRELENERRLYECDFVHEQKLELKLKEEPEVPGLNFKESIEMHLKYLPLKDELKNAIQQDDLYIIQIYFSRFENLDKKEKKQQDTIALFLAILCQADHVATYLIEKYAFRITENIESGIGINHLEFKHPKFEYARNHTDYITIGDYPLMAAVLLHRLDLVKQMKTYMSADMLLHESGCHHMTVNVPGTEEGLLNPKAVCMAAAMNQVEVLKVLLDASSYSSYHRAEFIKNMMQGNSASGSSLLEITLDFKSHDCFWYLIQKYDHNTISYDGSALLKIAKQYPEVLAQIIDIHGVSPILCEKDGPKLLHKLCENLKDETFIKSMKIILNFGGSKVINLEYNYMTPLICLAYYEHINEDLAIQMAKVLLEHGQSLGITMDGKTALDIAIWKKRDKFAKMLENHIIYMYENNEKLESESQRKDYELKKLKTQLKKQEEEMKQSKNDEEKQCVICLVNPKNMVCIPCGHLSVCEACVTNLGNKPCPMCREEGRFYKTY